MPKLPPEFLLRPRWVATGLGAFLLALGATTSVACRSSEPYSPAQAAQDRVRFLRQHGQTISPAGRQLIQGLPYGTRQQQAQQMNSVLLGGGGMSEDREWRRRSVLGLHREKKKQEEAEASSRSPSGEEENR